MDGHFSHLVVVKIVMFVWKTKIKLNFTIQWQVQKTNSSIFQINNEKHRCVPPIAVKIFPSNQWATFFNVFGLRQLCTQMFGFIFPTCHTWLNSFALLWRQQALKSAQSSSKEIITQIIISPSHPQLLYSTDKPRND